MLFFPGEIIFLRCFDGAETIRSSLGPQFAELVNQSIDLSMSNIISQLAMQELGEGGAQTPGADP